MKKKIKVKSEIIIAVSALILSIFTIFIYIYQAKIMAKQHQDSVWPYVYSATSFNVNDGLSIDVTNKGIGPALIKSLSIKFNGKEYSSWKELMRSINLDSISYTCSNISGTVLSPSESLRIFGVGNNAGARNVWQEFGLLEVIVEYCSIHDECWLVNDDGATKIKLKSLKKEVLSICH